MIIKQENHLSKIRKIFYQNKRMLILFCLFLVIAYGGYTQSWVFSDKDSGVPKPLLFDFLKPVPFWSLWMILSLPLIIITGFLTMIDITVSAVPQSLLMFIIVDVIYFYFLSKMIIFIYDWLGKKRNDQSQKTISGGK